MLRRERPEGDWAYPSDFDTFLPCPFHGASYDSGGNAVCNHHDFCVVNFILLAEDFIFLYLFILGLQLVVKFFQYFLTQP